MTLSCDGFRGRVELPTCCVPTLRKVPLQGGTQFKRLTARYSFGKLLLLCHFSSCATSNEVQREKQN